MLLTDGLVPDSVTIYRYKQTLIIERTHARPSRIRISMSDKMVAQRITTTYAKHYTVPPDPLYT